MFEKPVIDEITRIAHANKIEPAALLAVAEIESAGKPFEPADGKTPCLLFERHIFYRELKQRQPEKLQAAIAAGLAIPKWDKATQYQDEGTSAGRLRLVAKAKKVDEECAVRACSWGVGQTMGFLAEELGFGSAIDMLGQMTDGGIPAQVDCMVREIIRKKLDKKLAAHDWAGFALGYNGQGYRANRYDTKLAAAYDKWVLALDPDEPETGATPIDIPDTRTPESDVQPKSTSTISTASKVGTGVMGTGFFAWLAQQMAELPQSIIDIALSAGKNPLVLTVIAGGVAFLYIDHRRGVMKRDQGV
jgi:N-acetylmuramidase-like protein